MNRIDKLFRSRKKDILSVFFTAGHPFLDSTIQIINDLCLAGADMIEIGMPFSDPLADGPVIQSSSQTALRNGMSIDLLFKQLAGIRRNVSIPLLLMGYINPVMKFGVENFCRKCSESGIDGVIIPDLPPEIYLDQYSGIFEIYNLYNILLISPQVSDDRIRFIDSIGKGFLYIVSSYSVTGRKGTFTENQLSWFKKIRDLELTNPGLIGFGISDKPGFKIACENAEGAIIGSAFVNMLTLSRADQGQILKFVDGLIRQ